MTSYIRTINFYLCSLNSVSLSLRSCNSDLATKKIKWNLLVLGTVCCELSVMSTAPWKYDSMEASVKLLNELEVILYHLQEKVHIKSLSSKFSSFVVCQIKIFQHSFLLPLMAFVEFMVNSRELSILRLLYRPLLWIDILPAKRSIKLENTLTLRSTGWNQQLEPQTE